MTNYNAASLLTALSDITFRVRKMSLDETGTQDETRKGYFRFRVRYTLIANGNYRINI